MLEQFQNTNETFGLPKDGPVQIGVNDQDSGQLVEKGVFLPYPKEPENTWVYYDVALVTELDSGIVTHRPLPQTNPVADTLSSAQIESVGFVSAKGGVNTKSSGKFSYIKQRMADSVYRFCLTGKAMRIGMQVPIPALKSIGGVAAIPDDDRPQRAFNKIMGNYSGVPLFYAEWELWYTVLLPPKEQQTPPPNLGQYIRADEPLPPSGMQAPLSQPDDNAVPSIPTGTSPPLQNPVRGA